MMEIRHDYRRLLKAIRHEEPDRVPLAELNVDTPIMEQFMGRPIRDVEDRVAFWGAAGFDYTYVRANYDFEGTPPSVSAGTPRSWEWSASPETESVTTGRPGPIQSLNDIERYPWPHAETVDVSVIEKATAALLPGMGMITGVGGVFTRTWMILGYEHFCLSLMDNSTLVAQVADRVGQIQCDVLRRLVKMPRVCAIWYGDDLAYTEGLLASPGVLRKYFFPWAEELTHIAHDAGMPFIMHSDGALWSVLDDLIALGVDALHPIEAKAMDINELKQRYGHQLALFGNIDLGYTLTSGRGRPEDVRAEVRRKIRDLAPGGGYAVASGSGVTRYVSLENFNAMREATFEYGSYPIRL